MKHPVETYLHELHEARSTGGTRKETSYYSYLENLLNEIGKSLKPRVRCISQMADSGAGSPDFGLYTANQFQKSTSGDPIDGVLPERGVIEVKSVKDDSWIIADSKQVSKYWKHYGQVLVTNYRDFVLVGKNENDKPVVLETFRIADSEAKFWKSAQNPKKTAEVIGDRLLEYLKRVMLHNAPLSDPEVLAWYLASYAREARFRIDDATDLKGLDALRSSLEDSLGMKFEGENGEHFFRATLVQTLFYGIFSSWVLWARSNGKSAGAKFDWHDATWTLHVPMIAGLFHQIADPRKLKALGVSEVLDWTGAVLNRVSRNEFFTKFEEEHAVQYFYEPFLKAYDPQLRKDLGVWYTPHEIIKYQVGRVDTVLREDLQIPDGLADPSVYVLDPCCGTGAYLVEVLRKIHTTLELKGSGALTAQKLKEAAMKRVFGFEIMPAPFVISHLQLGLTLRNFDAPLADDKNERVGVYLTNALTGWEPPKDPKDRLRLPFVELQEEYEAANKVKRDTPILVILGNPPYNAFAGTSPKEEDGLVEEYKSGLTKSVKDGGWGVKKFNLDDLYVRFFRLAERRIAEKTGKGVLSYISNFSYLSDPSFVVMRKKFLEGFDKFWFDCMNGDSRETGKLTPEGKPDPSVFSTEHNWAGIRVGTAICTIVRKEKREQKPIIKFRHFWGVGKRNNLLDSLEEKKFDASYQHVEVSKDNRYSFRPTSVLGDYTRWPLITQIALKMPYNGPIERRGNSLIVHQADAFRFDGLKDYLNPEVTDEEIRSSVPEFMYSSGEFDAKKARNSLKGKVIFNPEAIRFYPFKPFDIRLAYLDVKIAPLFSRPSPDLLEQQTISKNCFFITRDTADKDIEGSPFLFSSLICDYDSISGHARHFPILIRTKSKKSQRNPSSTIDLVPEYKIEIPFVPNLSVESTNYLKSIGLKVVNGIDISVFHIWHHCLAIGYSQKYLFENADGIRQGWPRVPFPNSKEMLHASAALGEQVANLLDTEKSVPMVSSNPRRELTVMGVSTRVDGKALNPQKGDFDITAGWGHGGKEGITMPGRGKIVERSYTKEELEAIEIGAKELGLTSEQSLAVLGKDTRDIYLNDVAYWKNVPANVWEFYIGGYQVIKKWLSYREKEMLGRSLTLDEVEYVQEMIRRIAAIVLLQPTLDENYKKVKANTYTWPKAQ